MKVVINNDEIGNKIRNLREKENISLSKLAKITGISKNNLILYEEGNKQITITSIIKLCNYFNEKIDNIVSYKIIC